MAIPARKICTSPYHKGSRWLLSVYFNRKRYNSGNIGLQPYCQTCTRLSQRKENMSPEALRTLRRKQRRKYYYRETKYVIEMKTSKPTMKAPPPYNSFMANSSK